MMSHSLVSLDTPQGVSNGEGFGHGDTWLAMIFLGAVSFLLRYIIPSFWELQKARPAGKDHGNIPPTAPSLVPFLVHPLSFALDTGRFMDNMVKIFGRVPFRLNLFGESVYYLPPGHLVQSLFKSSRYQTTRPFLIAACHATGVPAQDMEILYRDGSGRGRKPTSGYEDMNPDHRLFYISFRDAHSFLTGHALDSLVIRFVANFTKHLHTTVKTSDNGWTEVPDLYIWFRDLMTHSLIESFCGEHLLSLNPSFVEEFWTFVSFFKILIRRPPRWLAPTAHRARDRATESVRRWQAHVTKHFDDNFEGLVNGTDQYPDMGSPLMQAYRIMLRKGGVSEQGAACLGLGMIFAMCSNLVPATFWALFGVHATDPSLRCRVRAEISPCFNPIAGELAPLEKLTNKPLLASVCMESLRYSVAVMPARRPLITGLQIGEWTIPEKNATIISMARHGSYDTEFWNQGRVLPSPCRNRNRTRYEHPVDTFWAERFLEYPNDPSSGPVLDRNNALFTGDTSDMMFDEPREKSLQDDGRARLIKDQRLHGYFFPYGGGSQMCPGRFFSNKIMTIAVAIATNGFDFEVDPSVTGENAPKPDTSYLPGTLPPDRSIPVRLRRRIRGAMS